jgi:ribosome recycling factor
MASDSILDFGLAGNKALEKRKPLMDLDEILLDVEDRMIKCVADYEAQLKSVRSGQASAEMVEHVHVNVPAYGGEVPLKQVALTTRADLRMLLIKPFDIKIIKEIDKGLQAANLGLSIQSDGRVIRLIFPALTEETRKRQIKVIKDALEQHKITVRNARHDALKQLKPLEKGAEGVSEDAVKKSEAEVNDLTKKYEAQLEGHFERKSKEIMTV